MISQIVLNLGNNFYASKTYAINQIKWRSHTEVFRKHRQILQYADNSEVK